MCFGTASVAIVYRSFIAYVAVWNESCSLISARTLTSLSLSTGYTLPRIQSKFVTFLCNPDISSHPWRANILETQQFGRCQRLLLLAVCDGLDHVDDKYVGTYAVVCRSPMLPMSLQKTFVPYVMWTGSPCCHVALSCSLMASVSMFPPNGTWLANYSWEKQFTSFMTLDLEWDPHRCCSEMKRERIESACNRGGILCRHFWRWRKLFKNLLPCVPEAHLVKHNASNAKIMGLVSQQHTYW